MESACWQTMSAPPSTPPDAHVSVLHPRQAGERDTLPDGWLTATLFTRIASPQPEERWKPDDRSGALIRPVTLFGTNVKERTAETGEPRSTIYDHANFFDAAGMASLLPVFPESEVS